ncbi:HAD hydrolase-like protein [Arthrobacter sp. JSM 101049]|uniref:HAD hydrolase-like protein n=1 Tax=Arthrobacter sp. JSM 101049 TaxID=929097 RepID=UPI003565F439
MIPARAVLFDLDGTLVDPAGGITGGILHALFRHGIRHPGDEHLESLVGPPLASGLMTVPGMTEELLPQVIADYRDQYAAHGMAASRVYPGIEELLTALRADGRILAVATSKPEPLARQLLAAKGLDGYFDSIHGSAPDEVSAPTRTSGKPHIVAAALQASGKGPQDTIMVGDRLHDIEGARANGLSAIGVAWGFAADGELEAAGAAAVVQSPADLGRLLGAAGAVVGATAREGSA